MKLKRIDESARKYTYDLSIPVHKSMTLRRRNKAWARLSFPVAWIDNGTLHILVKLPKSVEVNDVQDNVGQDA